MSLLDKTMGQRSKKLGACVICGNRVYKNQRYIEAVEGYTHRGCITS